MLATAMTFHGYNAEQLLLGTIVSLPKDLRGNICDSSNYRGICLSSCINKMLEWIMIDRYNEKFQTSDLQFSFKSEHSTSMCSLTLKEVVTYFRNRGSKVFACFVDASKAFDRLRHDKLFVLLRERGLHPLILRLIIDMYTRQKSRTTWNNVYSEYFDSVNGVRQGGVVSPIMFTIYMDELIIRLEKSGYGCFIGHEFYGCLGYADDFVILCPSVKGLQKMVDLCAEFGVEYSVSYNAIKTICMCFEAKLIRGTHNHKYKLLLNGTTLEWADCVKHLGNYIRKDLSEMDEIRHKQGDFIGRFNGVLARYADAVPQVLMKLTDSYCMHLYGCQAWQMSDKSVNKMITTWNRAIRRIWNLPPDSHRVLLCGLNQGKHVYDYVCARMSKMYKCMAENSNNKTKFLVELARTDKRSIISKNNDVIKKCDGKLFTEEEILNQEATVNTIVELNQGIPGFEQEEVQEILNFISTM